MPSFLSAEQVEMLRDELGRLQCPNDQDQIEALRALSDGLDNSDEAAFKAAWKRLKVGYGPRIGFCDEEDGRAVTSPPEPTVKAENERKRLIDHLDAIAPKTGDAAPSRPAVTSN